MKYTFTCEDIGTEWKNTVEFQESQIDDVIQNFKYFLKGCSYNSELVESRFEDENNDLDLSELFPEEDNTSQKVMSFTTDSLSSWPKGSLFESYSEDCPKCKVPLNIIHRHGCPDPSCTYNAN